MNKTGAILATAMFGIGLSLLSAAPALADHGYDSSLYGTNLHGTNCACDAGAEAAAGQVQQPTYARQSNPTVPGTAAQTEGR